MKNIKTVLLTGATGSIGRAIIKVLNSSSYRIAAQYNKNNNCVEELSQTYKNIKFYQANLLEFSQCEMLVNSVINDFSKIDILINNVGAIYGAENFINIMENNFDMTIDINFKSHFFITQFVYKNMLENKIVGKIINISSISAKYGGGENTLHYGCAKAALECFTKGLAKDASKYNILVNCVQLGFIESDFHLRLARTENDIKKRIEKIPLKRAGKPEEAADLIKFLCSDKANYITGQTLTVSGGD